MKKIISGGTGEFTDKKSSIPRRELNGFLKSCAMVEITFSFCLFACRPDVVIRTA
mgnify:CR=1 FL=1